MSHLTKSALLLAVLVSSVGFNPVMADGGGRAPAATASSAFGATARQTGFNGAAQYPVSPATLNAERLALAYRARPPHSNAACNRARFSANPVDFQGYDGADIPC